MRRPALLTVLALALPAAAHAAAPGRTLDLATGRLDGHAILGRTVAGVTAVLGRPDFRKRRPGYRIGWGDPHDFSVEIFFRRTGGPLRAWSIVLERGPARDPLLGGLLRLGPVRLPAEVRRAYGDRFELKRPLRCRHRFCSGELAPRPGSELHLTFGTRPRTGTWLVLWR